MLAQRLTRRVQRLGAHAGRRGRDIGVIPGVAAPKRQIRITERPVFEAADSAATVTWLGAVPETRIARARTLGDRWAELDRLHAINLPGRPLMVLSMPGASLATEDGVVITASGQLVYDTLWGDENFERSEINTRRRLRPATPLAGTCASLISLWQGNYHHWLFDALPRLAALELAELNHLPLIVPERLAAFQRDTLNVLGYPPDQWRAYAGEHVRPDTLVWPSPASIIGYPSRYAIDWLRRRLLPALITPSSARGRRIYVSRARASSRRVQNELDVIAALAPYGFETVHTELLTIREQAELFSTAEAVVAPHGAGISNILFGTRLAVLEIAQPRYMNSCYYTLAGTCRHHYWYLLAEPHGRARKEADLIVPIDLLSETVELMLTR
jgi:capsular polysaccharide biosynthesis protein